MNLKQAIETLDRATALVQTDRMGHQQIITALQTVHKALADQIQTEMESEPEAQMSETE